VLAGFVLGATPALTILADEPAAMATPYAQEPGGPELSGDEQEALDNKNAGRPYDEGAFKRANDKLKTNEKYNGERNKQKQRGGPRRR
jgi:hypothetical protein